jgi:hypothetical protein
MRQGKKYHETTLVYLFERLFEKDEQFTNSFNLALEVEMDLLRGFTLEWLPNSLIRTKISEITGNWQILVELTQGRLLAEANNYTLCEFTVFSAFNIELLDNIDTYTDKQLDMLAKRSYNQVAVNLKDRDSLLYASKEVESDYFYKYLDFNEKSASKNFFKMLKILQDLRPDLMRHGRRNDYMWGDSPAVSILSILKWLHRNKKLPEKYRKSLQEAQQIQLRELFEASFKPAPDSN